MKSFLVALLLSVSGGCGDTGPCPDLPCGNVPLAIQIDFQTRPTAAIHTFSALTEAVVYTCDVEVTAENKTTVGVCADSGGRLTMVTELDRATATMNLPGYPKTIDLLVTVPSGPVTSNRVTPIYNVKPADHCGPACTYDASADVTVP